MSSEAIGILRGGFGKGKEFIAKDGYFLQIKNKFGFDPFCGTLNIEIKEENVSGLLKDKKLFVIDGFVEKDRQFGSVDCYKIKISKYENEKFVDGIIIVPKNTSHPKNIIEIVSKYHLREKLCIKEGDKVIIK